MHSSLKWVLPPNPVDGSLVCAAIHRLVGTSLTRERPISSMTRADTDDDDVRLVARALEGDRPTQRTLAQRLIGSIQKEVSILLARAAVVSRRDPRQETADMVQEVLISLFEADGRELRRWDPTRGRKLESFVRLVARRRVARILSQRRGNPWADNPVDPQTMGNHDDAGQVRRVQARCDLDSLLVALYARMNARDHELFDLLYIQELAPPDAARKLGMSRAAVNAWSYRTRKLARELASSVVETTSPPPGPTAEGEVCHGG